MTATEILDKITRSGCRVTLTGEQLKVTGPLTDSLRAAIRENKAALVAELQRREAEPINYPAETEKVRQVLRQQGWAAIRSQALDGEIMLWTLDSAAEVPKQWSGCVRYDLDELQALSTGPKVDAAGLRMIHEAKRIFDGQVCSNA